MLGRIAQIVGILETWAVGYRLKFNSLDHISLFGPAGATLGERRSNEGDEIWSVAEPVHLTSMPLPAWPASWTRSSSIRPRLDQPR
jgi:hypothetical protein